MLRLALAVVIVALLATPSFAQETHSGRIEPGFINRYTLTPAVSGQLLATLSWDSSSADLIVIMSCTIEGDELGFGAATGLLDRFARFEAGVLGGFPCEIGVMTVSSSASYLLNLQLAGGQSSSAQAPAPIPRSRVSRRTVIPGTSRGDAIDSHGVPAAAGSQSVEDGLQS